MANVSAFDANQYNEEIKRTLPYYNYILNEICWLVTINHSNAETWLDIGCGTGELLRRACDQFPRIAFTACDVDPEMLAVSRSYLRDVENLNFIEADVESADFQDVSFGIITAVQVMHFLEADRRSSVLRNIYRHLSAGGIYITVNNTAMASDYGTQLSLQRWKEYQMRAGRTGEEAARHIARYGVNYYPITVEEQKKELHAAGFSIVELFWFSNMQAGIYAIK